jgi:hydrogenase maturation protease
LIVVKVSAELASTTPRSEKSPRLLVVGCGNFLMGDDGAGVEVVQRLIEVRQSTDCQLCLMLSGGVDLLEMLPSADLILFVDAVTSGAPVGTLHLVPLLAAEVVLRSLGSVSTHGWGLLETLELARALGRPLPRAMLLGVEIGEVTPGAQRSPAVARGLALVVQRFSRLRSLLVDPESVLWRSARHFPPDDATFPGDE